MDYDFQETSPDGSYTAALTNAQLSSPGMPPVSTLTLTSAEGDELGHWTLGTHEFWTADPDANRIAPGSFDVAGRTYSHEVFTGNYSPGTPLTERAVRNFIF